MKLNLLNTPSGLKPLYDEDYEEKRKLKLGVVYSAEIRIPRNYKFHKKFFALLNTAWAYLPERTQNGFRSINGFRQYLTVAAGHYDTFFSPSRKEFVEIPKSISFGSMSEEEFEELYENVYRVIFSIIGKYVNEEDFKTNLANF